MNKELWQKIVQFDFDSPPSEYGFSVRLANENFWTKDFTELAIIEYKKFMYLAATSEYMVSPSAIVDTVWHQHLIFTQLYQDFCSLIGKQIQHIPSTHNKEDFDKFNKAKACTKKLYTHIFGEQPSTIWEYNTMYDCLNLDKSKFKIRTFISGGIFAIIVLIIPAYLFLKSIYLQINNPKFIVGFFALCIITFIALEVYNRNRLKTIVKTFHKDSFIYKLHPLELVYLKTQKLETIIDAAVNELIQNKTIIVDSKNLIQLKNSDRANSQEAFQTIAALNELGKTYYPNLLRKLVNKPIFRNTENCMDAFRKYFQKSKKFGHLFYLNFGILTVLLMLGFVRLIGGILTEKPIMLILIAIIILVVIIIGYLKRLTRLVCTQTIPNLYKTEILPTKSIENNWQWSYFLFGSSVLATAFLPLINSRTYNNGSSCATSCGSSCSSCGGCGGD
jgi:hypothetical protein